MAAHHGSEPLISPTGQLSSAVFGFIRMLRPVIENVLFKFPMEPVKCVVAWDSSPSWREQVYPDYKKSRKDARTPESEQSLQAYFSQVPIIRRILTDLGVGQIKVENEEADDIAGWLSQRDANFVLMSGDKDWLQLIGPRCEVWQPSRGRYVNQDNFAEITAGMIGAKDGVCCNTPDDLVRMLAIAGDSGDDVPGVKGVGYSTAVKYMNGSLVKGKKFDAIEAWMKEPDGYARSHKLIDLRTRSVDLTKASVKPGQFEASRVVHEFSELGFNSLLAEFGKWVEPYQFVSK